MKSLINEVAEHRFDKIKNLELIEKLLKVCEQYELCFADDDERITFEDRLISALEDVLVIDANDDPDCPHGCHCEKVKGCPLNGRS